MTEKRGISLPLRLPVRGKDIHIKCVLTIEGENSIECYKEEECRDGRGGN